MQLTSDGFFLEAHPKLMPVDAATRGVFYAGCAEGPKDIKESVTQASAAAVRAIRLMHKGEILTEPITSEVIAEHCKGLRPVRGSLSLPCHHRRRQEEASRRRQHRSLCRMRHLRRGMRLRRHSHEPLQRRADPGADRHHAG